MQKCAYRLITGSIVGLNRIEPIEAFDLSFSRGARKGFFKTVVRRLTFVLVIGLTFGLIVGLIFVLVIGLMFLLMGGITG